MSRHSKGPPRRRPKISTGKQPGGSNSAIACQLKEIKESLDEIKGMLRYDQRIATERQEQMDDTFEDLEKLMAEDKTVSDGIYTLVEGLEKKIAEGVTSAADKERIAKIFAGFKANTDKLATKLLTGTPEGGSTGGIGGSTGGVA